MEEFSPTKEILYNEIKKISEKQIHQFLINEEYFKCIQQLLVGILPKLKKIEGNIDEKIVILAESISHYIFTEMLIPSQRKIVHKKIEIDIVIPNIDSLESKSDDVIIIYFVKSDDEYIKKIEQIKKIQQNHNNIWIVSHNKFHTPCKLYIINQQENTFPNLFRDVQKFVTDRKQNKLKIFKT
jgi:hypothetical protein